MKFFQSIIFLLLSLSISAQTDYDNYYKGIAAIEYEKWIKSFGIVNEKKLDEFLAQIQERIDQVGSVAATLEGKRFVSESEEAEAQAKYKGLLSMFGMMGTPLVQVIPEFETKTSQEVQDGIDKALKGFFGDTLKFIMEAVGVNSQLLDDFVKMIQDNPDIMDTFGGT